MKRKISRDASSPIPKEILDQAKRSLDTDRARPAPRCTVCGSECPPNSREKLCWVCRRLKISAWLESDHQVPAQE